MSGKWDFLRLPRFWRFYVRLGGTPLDGEALGLFGATTINGEAYAESIISLRCGEGCFLELTVTPQLAMVNLGLRTARTSHSAEMGWWDDARWHPFALRWWELERLHQYWLDEPIDGVPPSAAFLLLAVFVGHGADEHGLVAERKEVVAEHYRRLALFSPSEVAELSERTVILPAEDDYKWSRDGELSWVFGGEYPCYSLRNREHSGGEEGRFPFAEWSRIVAQLPAAGGAT
jgi:hypothetical protein